MDGPRKYRDHEVREIFALASTGDDGNRPSVQAQEGLTLSELQDVGREAGLEPERIAHAALVLSARQEVLPRGTTLGMPTSVGRIVELPDAPSQQEWELLVAEIAHTFGGVGEVTAQGNLRQWSNGEVHAFLEPTEAGYRLRMTTDNSSASEVNALGGIGLAFGMFLLVILFFAGKLDVAFALPAVFGLLGAGALASNVVRLPKWADKREHQMEYIANRAKALVGSIPKDDDSGE